MREEVTVESSSPESGADKNYTFGEGSNTAREFHLIDPGELTFEDSLKSSELLLGELSKTSLEGNKRDVHYISYKLDFSFKNPYINSLSISAGVIYDPVTQEKYSKFCLGVSNEQNLKNYLPENWKFPDLNFTPEYSKEQMNNASDNFWEVKATGSIEVPFLDGEYGLTINENGVKQGGSIKHDRDLKLGGSVKVEGCMINKHDDSSSRTEERIIGLRSRYTI